MERLTRGKQVPFLDCDSRECNLQGSWMIGSLGCVLVLDLIYNMAVLLCNTLMVMGGTALAIPSRASQQHGSAPATRGTVEIVGMLVNTVGVVVRASLSRADSESQLSIPLAGTTAARKMLESSWSAPDPSSVLSRLCSFRDTIFSSEARCRSMHLNASHARR